MPKLVDSKERLASKFNNLRLTLKFLHLATYLVEKIYQNGGKSLIFGEYISCNGMKEFTKLLENCD